MSYTSAMPASERPPQRDGVTIRAIENEEIVPGEYDVDDDARVEREIKTSASASVVRPKIGERIRLIYLKLINIQRTNERRNCGRREREGGNT